MILVGRPVDSSNVSYMGSPHGNLVYTRTDGTLSWPGTAGALQAQANGSGVKVATREHRFVSDTGVGFDASLLDLEVSLIELGVGADLASWVATSMSTFGCSVGEDSAADTALEVVEELGVGLDLAIRLAQIGAFDAGVGYDLCNNGSGLYTEDTGVGTEGFAVVWALLGQAADASVGDDSSTFGSRQGGFDSAGGRDSIKDIAHEKPTGAGSGLDTALNGLKYVLGDAAAGLDAIVSFLAAVAAAERSAGQDEATSWWTPHTPTAVSVTGVQSTKIPPWCRYIDIIALGGGGGGGGGGAGWQDGQGGSSGVFASATLERGVHIPLTNVSFYTNPGDPVGGGVNGNESVVADGAGPGGYVNVRVQAAGGPRGSGVNPIDGNWHIGKSPGTHSYGGQSYPGGISQSGKGSAGNAPGGGGGGGEGGTISGKGGGGGARGQVWFRFYQ